MQNYPFSEDELTIVKEYKANGAAGRSLPQFNTPITARENMRAFARGEKPCWMPDGEMVNIYPDIVPDNIARYFVQETNPNVIKGGSDMFGTMWVYEETARGSMVVPGNPRLLDANDWREVIQMPDVDSWDWEGCAARNKDYLDTDAPIFTVQLTGLFERLISFMDFEGAALALIDEDQQDAVKELFEALTDVYIKILDNYIKYFHIDGYTFHDDWGAQRSPFFSRDTWQEMIAPYVKKMVDHCHKNNVIFELHSCGHIDSMIDLIASLGIDMWRPQPMNDLDAMYRDYGDKIRLGYRSEVGVSPMMAQQGPALSDEELAQAAKDLVARFNIPGHYVYTGPYNPLPYRKALYEASRKAYLAE